MPLFGVKEKTYRKDAKTLGAKLSTLDCLVTFGKSFEDEIADADFNERDLLRTCNSTACLSHLVKQCQASQHPMPTETRGITWSENVGCRWL